MQVERCCCGVAAFVLWRETCDAIDCVYVGDLECSVCGRRYLDSRKATERRRTPLVLHQETLPWESDDPSG